MRLKSIKFVGFKSFVDPTTITFKSNLSGIVGPNGCGKSNVIDAVRWVLGESSAKQLRGHTMTDVIFNGSNERKPVGQAVIELLFDNSLGRIGGAYATYSEISVKRKVLRDGTNDYYLNGTKCRRKDITDLFLGTGLGPRSYAIIEQGIISDLIVAKPEELRVYIEEAAGISKYKERRRETENRIAQTRENLERLVDIRDEVGNLLRKLQRQSRLAEQYRQFKVEQRKLTTQLHALRWQDYQQQIEQLQNQIHRENVCLQKWVTEDTKLQSAREVLFASQTEKNQQLNITQGEFYQVGSETSKMEQTIKHVQQRKIQLNEDIQQTQLNLNEINQSLKADVSKIKGWKAELSQLVNQSQKGQQKERKYNQLLDTAENTLKKYQSEWSEINQQVVNAFQSIEIQKTQAEQLKFNIDDLNNKITTFEQGQQTLESGCSIEVMAQEIEQLRQQSVQVKMILQRATQTQRDCQNNIKLLSVEHEEKLLSLNELRIDIQKLHGRVEALTSMQHTKKTYTASYQKWLESIGFDGLPLLYEQLQVTHGWEKAVEAVMEQFINHICIPKISPESIEGLADIEHEIMFLEPVNKFAKESKFNLTNICSVIDGDYIPSVFSAVYITETLNTALQVRTQLLGSEMVVTRDGIVLGLNWIGKSGFNNSEKGKLERQKQLKETQVHLKTAEQSESLLHLELEKMQESLKSLQQAHTESQLQIEQSLAQLSTVQAQLTDKKLQLEQFSFKKQQLEQERDSANQLLVIEQSKLAKFQELISKASQFMDKAQQQEKKALQLKQEAQSQYEKIQQQSKDAQVEYSQLLLRERTVQTQLQVIEEGTIRLVTQQKRSEEQLALLQKQLSEEVIPADNYQQELDEKLKQRIKIEQLVIVKREELNAINNQIQALDQQGGKSKNTIQEQREKVQRLALDMQALISRQHVLIEQVDEKTIAQILTELTEYNDIEQCHTDLQQVNMRIQQLGAVNLAAVDEYEIEVKRKKYLDSQDLQLNQALEILEQTMRKIDKETRTRFKETFDIINGEVKKIFPKLFGGGHACLELTGTDILSTGVRIMARPPGKRNTSIQLLSGGEKALMAIVLIFAIFELNPAPFCMLDEVDAPLDDANMNRFAQMVNEMAEHVQFIFVSHNKIAIEMARQLMGVTMSEAGVSRVVSIDIDASIKVVS